MSGWDNVRSGQLRGQCALSTEPAGELLFPLTTQPVPRTLIATVRLPWLVSTARQTSPMPPTPRRASSRYGPKTSAVTHAPNRRSRCAPPIDQRLVAGDECGGEVLEDLLDAVGHRALGDAVPEEVAP